LHNSSRTKRRDKIARLRDAMLGKIDVLREEFAPYEFSHPEVYRKSLEACFLCAKGLIAIDDIVKQLGG